MRYKKRSILLIYDIVCFRFLPWQLHSFLHHYESAGITCTQIKVTVRLALLAHERLATRDWPSWTKPVILRNIIKIKR